MKYIYLLVAFLLIDISVKAEDCYDGRYRDYVFTDYEVDANNVYARKQKSNGGFQNLRYDVYTPKGDTLTERPIAFLAHGGGFIDLVDQKSPDIVRMAQDLVARGYVVISVEYREEPTVFSLFSEEAMVKALARALIDIRDATCYLVDTTINYGNPYGIDIDRVIIGGVSAGAVSFLQAVFLDSVTFAPPQYQEWILEVEPNTQALLDNKYCGATVLGVINVSGAILDTNWIKEYNKDIYPPIMHIHGTEDGIVPYNIDRPFGLPTLPELMGSFPIDERLKQIGVRSELDTWVGLGHVPFFGFDFEAIFSGNPIDAFFTPTVLNPFLEHMGEFCYSLIGCNEVETPTIINTSVVKALNFYPNPNNGNFTINLPDNKNGQVGTIRVINAGGQVVYADEVSTNTIGINLGNQLARGIYSIIVDYQGPVEDKRFVGQLMVTN